uniref:Uncharacterized protein n=1 Tax=Solanum lycopersicum TaxID=4081 RepID=A0A3Q7GT36_SOLLC
MICLNLVICYSSYAARYIQCKHNIHMQTICLGWIPVGKILLMSLIGFCILFIRWLS